MARRTKSKRRANPNKEIPIKITPSVSEATPSFYCNFATVSHGQFDFVLTFVKVPTPLSDIQIESAQRDRRLLVDASLQIVVAPKFLPKLISALDEQKRKYEESFGAIEASRPDTPSKRVQRR
jgi:uncharacterized protein DUF3467